MPSVRALHDSVLGRFDAAPFWGVWRADDPQPSTLPTVLVHDARVKADLTEQYVVAYPDAGNRYADRQGGVSDALDWGVRFVCVGRSPGQVLTLAGNLRTRMAAWSPDPIPERSSWVEEPIGAPIIPDVDDPNNPTFSLTVRYVLNNTRS